MHHDRELKQELSRAFAYAERMGYSPSDTLATLQGVEALYYRKHPSRRPHKATGALAAIEPVKDPEKPKSEAADKSSALIYLSMGIEAMKSARYASAWRAWRLANTFDVQGRGVVKRHELIAWAKRHKVNERSLARWIRLAIMRGLIGKSKGKDGSINLWLKSAAHVAAIMKIQSFSRDRFSMSVTRLGSTEWRAFIWAGYIRSNQPYAKETANGRKLISRSGRLSNKKMAEITGVTERTQRRYEGIANISSRSDYGETNTPNFFMEEYAQEREADGWSPPFEGYTGNLLIRLPSKREAPGSIPKHTHYGRANKIAKHLALFYGNHASDTQGNQEPQRLFIHDEKEYAKAEKALRANSDLGVKNLFIVPDAKSNRRLWSVQSLQTQALI